LYQYETLFDLIKDRSVSTDKGIYFVSDCRGDKFVSYNSLFKNAAGYLYLMQSAGLTAGQEVIIQTEDNEKFVYLFWACILGGLVPVLLSASANDETFWKIFNVWKMLDKPSIIMSEKYIVRMKTFLEKNGLSIDVSEIVKNTISLDNFNDTLQEGILHKPNRDSVAVMKFSSGSTGDPKGIVMKQHNLLVNLKGIIHCAEINKNDTMLNWMTLTHDIGLLIFHVTSIMAGINQIQIPTPLFLRSPDLWMEKAHQYKATISVSPNFGYIHFIGQIQQKFAKGWDLSHLRIIMNGGEPISDDICDKFLNMLKEYNLNNTSMFPIYGLSETSVVTFSTPGKKYVAHNVDRRHLAVGSKIVFVPKDDSNCLTFVDVGYPLECCMVKICDEDGATLEEGVVGHIKVCGENVTTGYYKNTNATKQLFSEDGWLNTGDLGFMVNGRLTITGRAKDIVIVNGQNYYYHDLERILEKVEGVETGGVVVFSTQNPVLHKEDIIVYILDKDGKLDINLIENKVKRCIMKELGLEIKRVIPVSMFPRTGSGKIKRNALILQHKLH